MIIKRRTSLYEFLTEEQKQCLSYHGYFNIRGSNGGKYRIFTHTNSGNVEHWSDSYGWISECAHPRYYPSFDDVVSGTTARESQIYIEESLIAQKLIIEHDEEFWARIANKAY